MRMKRIWIGGAGLAAALAAVFASAAVPAADGLRHAVACPAFDGPAEMAGPYHEELVRTLEETAGIELVDESWLPLRRGPEFMYRIEGAIVEGDDESWFVTLGLVDVKRREKIASFVAPVASEPASLASWSGAIRKDLERRMARLPFECSLKRRRGQNSWSLDRGLSAGLQPGMELVAARTDEELLSPTTGEVIGLESFRPVGRIVVFRVMEDTAYARPVEGTQLPRIKDLHARSF